MEIYKILSQIMEERNLKIADIAKMCNLPDSTVRGIEKRKQDTVALEVAFKLSKGLGVSLEYLNGMPESENNGQFNNTNIGFENIITKYRFVSKYSPEGARTVDAILDREYHIAEQMEEKSKRIAEIEANAPQPNIHNSDVRLINYYYRLASAGTGQIVFDMPPTKRIEIPNIPEYRKVDYAIGVNGNSMEPVYHDGDMLLVEMTDEVDPGEIGIFLVNGESYVKKQGDRELISLNPECDNVPLIADSKCMGKVVGAL